MPRPLFPQERTPVSTEQEAGWIPLLVWIARTISNSWFGIEVVL